MWAWIIALAASPCGRRCTSDKRHSTSTHRSEKIVECIRARLPPAAATAEMAGVVEPTGGSAAEAPAFAAWVPAGFTDGGLY